MTSFTRVISDVRDGQLLEQCSNEFAQLIESVQETGKSGAFTLTLKVRPNGERAVAISSAIKTSVPKPSIGEAMFFTQDGNLFRRDPRQTDIEDELAKKRREAEEQKQGGAQ